jgi:hypothetical protein
MPYLNKEKKAERTREYRKEVVEQKLYLCQHCQHAFQTSFSLKKHEKALSCPNLDMSTPSTLNEEDNVPRGNVRVLRDGECDSQGNTWEDYEHMYWQLWAWEYDRYGGRIG